MKYFAIWILTLCLFALGGCSGENSTDDVTGTAEDVPKHPEAESLGHSRDLPIPAIAVRPLEIRTAEPGFVVFVNGYPARTLAGELLRTPCRVQIPSGTSERDQITACKDGFEDVIKTLSGAEQSELFFDKPQPENEFTMSLLSGPLLNTEIGRPVSLLSLNSGGGELDPFLDSDGLAIWFVGDRDEGRAIYRAERESRYDFFDPPEILRATQSGDLPATPNVTAAGKLVYVVPEKKRILTVSTNPKAYERPEILRQGTRANVLWESAAISPDGSRLYWTERPEGSRDRRGLAAYRTVPGEPYRETEEFNLPGLFPCLSGDGLRQYVFDGKILKRARRKTEYAQFASPEILANYDPRLYKPDPDRRSFWVTGDEEWLFYADAGDLFAVRLSFGPGWGYAPVGDSIAPRLKIAEVKPPDPGSLPFIPMPVPETPTETGPPYPNFRAEFVELLKNREYEKADAALTKAERDPRFEPDRAVLEWDREEWRSVTGFWESLRDRLNTMPPGTEFSIRTAKVKFLRFEDDVIHFRLNKSGTKPLAEMQPRDMAALMDPLEKVDATARMQIGLFLYFDVAGSQKLAETYLENAGKSAQDFKDRLAGRVLHNARRELAEGEIARGLEYLENLLAAYPNSPAAELAKTLEAELYEQVKWEPTGPRKWEQPEAGLYRADKTRQAQSYLVSPKTYSHFELRLEWKITEPGGSGGVFFRYAAPGREDPYRKAFKVQVADDRDFKPDPQTTGALHTYEAPSENRSKPRGEWNTLRLRVENLNVEVWINGKMVLDTIAQSDIVPLEGFVALDGITGGIAYRKALLVELSPSVE